MQTLEKTSIRKSFRDNTWKGETVIKNVNGFDWTISTLKYGSGMIVSTAYAGSHHEDDNFTSFDYGLMGLGDKNPRTVPLIKENARATESKIRELHTRALLKFDQLKEQGELPVNKVAYDVQVGQVIFLNGYGQDEHHHDQLGIYHIEKAGATTHYHAVNLKTHALTIETHIRDIKDKFGIGMYYKKGDFIDIDQLNNIVLEAKKKQEQDNIKAQADKLLEKEIIDTKIEEGKKIVNIPSWAKAIIVARYKKDESDYQSDYHGHSVGRIIYLAFSKNTRDLFPEMRKAALNSKETKHLATAPEEFEHREKYSMGAGYYLAEGRHSGIEISKCHLDIQNQNTLNKLFIAAAEGRYFCNTNNNLSSQTTATKPEVNAEGLEILDYSVKAFVVHGDTKPVKDILKSMGGRFNFRLKHPQTGQQLTGWVFPNPKLDLVKKELGL